MHDFQVSEPILNSPYQEPSRHWKIFEDQPPELVVARRLPVYYYRFPGKETQSTQREDRGIAVELKLVSIIRAQVKAWVAAGYPGASATTLDLLHHWSREGRPVPLFFAQREAAQTVIFLTEARADFLQGINIPLDEPSEAAKAEGLRAFKRLACKMATGTGKTTVMGMLAAWSILNKVANPSDRRFSDAVLVVCPNVTIRNRLAELDPMAGEASLYRTRDLVPARLMTELKQGRVLVTNWHAFEKQSPQGASRVVKTGVPQTRQETIRIGEKSTTARGSRYLSLRDYEQQVMLGLIEPIKEYRDEQGHLEKVDVRATRYVESDTKWLRRVLGTAFGGKQNILVLNDEAHHAYRIRSESPDAEEDDIFGEDEEAEAYFKEATVWVEGLDRIHKHRGINTCLDFSATPYFLGRVSNMANRPFPWVVSDFGLTEAIESGLTKIPQLAVRDSTGNSIPGYFNIWRWILPQLTSTERGGKKAAPKPEAILRYAHTPIAMLGGLWRETFQQWQRDGEDRPPVFILVCKNTKIAKVVHEWLAENKPPHGVPASGLPELMNCDGALNTIRVDSKVVDEVDSGSSKSDEDRWMRFILDTVGRREWPRDAQGMPLYPDGFEALADKLQRPKDVPPGRGVRCIVSVGMLTEGWDCNTVTHIVGLRPFMSQLLCEQVVGRALRRASYAVGENDLLSEEIAQVFGVPFEVVPFKDNPKRERPEPAKTWRIRALPERADLEIKFPRVEGYVQQSVASLRFDLSAVPVLTVDPTHIPQEVQMKAGLASNTGRPSIYGPGALSSVTLNPFRQGRRAQALVFDAARELAREVQQQSAGALTAVEVFAPCLNVIHEFLSSRVIVLGQAQVVDVFLAPYYGVMLEGLTEAMRFGGDAAAELPKLESHRPPGTTADVDFVTRRQPVPVLKSHVNAVVPDTQKWEQQAAYFIDSHPNVLAFVKNAGLGLGIPYSHQGQRHDYVPDFVVVLANGLHLLLETKGFDPLAETKALAAQRWVSAVNQHGGFGTWRYCLVREPNDIPGLLSEFGA
jgi:type III restriction enzyme